MSTESLNRWASSTCQRLVISGINVYHYLIIAKSHLFACYPLTCAKYAAEISWYDFPLPDGTDFL